MIHQAETVYIINKMEQFPKDQEIEKIVGLYIDSKQMPLDRDNDKEFGKLQEIEEDLKEGNYEKALDYFESKKNPNLGERELTRYLSERYYQKTGQVDEGKLVSLPLDPSLKALSEYARALDEKDKKRLSKLIEKDLNVIYKYFSEHHDSRDRKLSIINSLETLITVLEKRIQGRKEQQMEVRFDRVVKNTLVKELAYLKDFDVKTEMANYGTPEYFNRKGMRGLGVNYEKRFSN